MPPVQHDRDGLVAVVTGASQGRGRAFLASPAAGAVTAQSVKAAGGLPT